MPFDARAIPDVLHWYEGMLLMPEHFQQASRRQEALSGYLAGAATPYFWGVREIETEIVEGVLRVLSLEAVMPDGLVVRYSAADPDDAPLQIDLALHKGALEARKRLAVHLVVTAWSDRAVALDGAEDGALARYRPVRGAPLEPDDIDPPGGAPGEAMRERPWLRPVLRLHVTDGPLVAPPAKYVSLPIARVLQNAESTIVADRYEPPRNALRGAREIAECAQAVAGELRVKARFLNERLQREGLPDRAATSAIPTIEMQLRQLARRFHALQSNVENLQSLVRTLPRLEALRQDPETHPHALHLALCDVAGDLAVLGGELSLPEIPRYQHADPLHGFDFLERHILLVLETLNQRYRIFAFERATPGRFELAISPDELGRRFVVGALRAKGTPASPVAEWMNKAVIATRDQLADLKRRRVSGAAREQIERDDTLDLNAPAMTSLFRVDTGDEGIDPGDAVLVVENNAAEAPSAVLLYLPRGGESGPGPDAP